MRPDRALTARERAAAEARLERDTEHVIVPLAQMRAVNHISEDISALIRRRFRGEAGDS